MPIAVDFETFYSTHYTVKKLGPDEYVRHELFDPYLVSIVGLGVEYVGHPKGAPWDQINGQIWVSHNAAFDHRVFLQAQKLKIIPAHIQPAVWHCTADMCAYLQMPRDLMGAAKEMLGVEVSKVVRAEMKGRKIEQLTGEERTALFEYALDDACLCLRLWNDFNHRWPKQEKDLSVHSRLAGMRGVHLDKPLISENIQKLALIKEEAARKLPWAEYAKILSPKALKDACAEAGIPAPASTAEDNEECIAWEKQFGERIPFVSALRTWRKANRAQKVLEKMLRWVNAEGKMPFALKYYGANATGRWSGDAGLNMQNLTRVEQHGVDMRKGLIAAPGKSFICADLSTIEPRVLAYNCGDQEMLSQMAAGGDLYTSHARATMGYTDPRPLKDVDPQMRLLAKVRCLGLGYGCGPDTFIEVAANYGLVVSQQESSDMVSEYRTSNPKITAYWDQLQEEFLLADGGNYILQLPSGRSITYFDVRRSDGSASTIKGGQRRWFYGGKLVENATQATARDVFAAAYWRILQAGYDVIWTVHDELIVEVDDANAEVARKEIERLISETPFWMPGLPIAAEVTITKHYRK